MGHAPRGPLGLATTCCRHNHNHLFLVLATTLLVLAPKLSLGQSLGTDDEPLIVINSMHSTRSGQQHHAAGRIRPNSNHSFVPFQAPRPSHQHQQPSQEFDSDRHAINSYHQAHGTRSNYTPASHHSGGGSNHRVRPATQQQQQPVDGSAQLKQRAPLPIRDNFFHTNAAQSQQQQAVGGGVSAPYALQATATSGSGNLATINNQHQRAPSFQFQHHGQHAAAPVSLIRDTSELTGSGGGEGEQAFAGAEQATSFNSIAYNPPAYESNESMQKVAAAGLLWVQSIRDNHAGPLRSRFDLPPGGASSQVSVSSFGASPGPNLHAPRPPGDGLTRARWPPASTQEPDATAWQLQAKAARGQMVSPTTPSDTADLASSVSAAAASGLRKNSKFTREAEQTTTPVSATNGTTNQAAELEEVATGSGQVLPLSETDLVILEGQKFEVDSRAAPSGGKVANENGGGQATPPLVFSNNHSTKGKPPGGRLSVSGEVPETAQLLRQSSEGLPLKRLGRQLNYFDTTRTPVATNQRADWSGVLPALLQRTLGSLLRRLTGTAAASAQQQQQHQPPVSTLVKPQPSPLEQMRGQSFAAAAAAAAAAAQQHNSLHLDSLLASAISAAAAAAASQKPATTNQNSFVMTNGGGESGRQVMASQIDESAIAPTTTQMRAKNPALRQHANKKIIDSFVDLPASERRSSNGGDAGVFHQPAKLWNTQMAATALDLKAEPRRVKRAAAAEDEEGDNESSAGSDGSETDEEGVAMSSGDRDDTDGLQQPRTSASVKSAVATPTGGSRGRGRAKTQHSPEEEIEPAETHMEIRAVASDGEETGEDDGENEDSLMNSPDLAAETSDPEAESQDQPHPVRGGEEEISEPTGRGGAPPMGVQDDLQAEASTDEESRQPQTIGFYAPQGGFSAYEFADSDAARNDETGESLERQDEDLDLQEEQESAPPPPRSTAIKKRKQVRSTQRPASKYKNHERRTQIRRPPLAPPIEPPAHLDETLMGSSSGHQSIMPPRRRNNHHQLAGQRRTRPPSAHLHLRPPSEQQPPTPVDSHQHDQLVVPHLDLNGVRSSLLGSTSLSSSLGPTASRRRPHPQKPGHKTGSGPPSSQQPLKSQAPGPLNVLVPSVQMATEGGGGDHQSAAAHSSLMTPMSSSINVMDLDRSMTRLAHNKLIVAKFKPTRRATHNKPRADQQMAPPTTVHQQQQQQQSRSSTPRHWEPPLVHQAESDDALQLDRESRPTEPSVSASLASAVLGSRVITNKHISDIISRWTRPSLAAPAATSQRPTSTTTTTTTTTQSPSTTTSTPDSAGNDNELGDESTLNGRVQQVPRPSQRPPLDLLLAHAQANPPINRNDKFNFSMATMHNRERINPLLFPVDVQNRLSAQMANNASISSMLNKMQKHPARAKLSTTTTSTSTTTTTTTTTTTRKPIVRASTSSFNYHHRPLNKGSTSSTTTTSTTTTTTTPSPIIDLEPLVNLDPLPASEDYQQLPANVATSATSTTTQRPVQEIFLAPTKPIQYKPKFKPALVVSSIESFKDQDDPGNDNYIGQIVRNQHHQHQTSQQEQQRLRNQYLALVGGGRSSSKNSTILSGAPSSQASEQSDGWFLAPNQPATNGTSASTTTAEAIAAALAVVEEAAHEANRYTVTLNQPQLQADASEHSIVIMSDNHKHLRRRPPQSSQQLFSPSAPASSGESDKFLYHNNHSGAGAPPTRPPPLFASMHYSSQAMLDLGELATTTLAPATTTTSAAAQLARKYLEEFVNGTRVRPSSMKTTTTTESPPPATAGDSERPPGADGLQLFTTNNHSRGPQPAVPASKSGSQEAQGKLDQQAHALLLDLFDRDPAYSASLIAAHHQSASRGQPSSKEDLEHSSKGDKLRRIYEQLMQNSQRVNDQNNMKISGKRQPVRDSLTGSSTSLSDTTITTRQATPTTTEMPSSSAVASEVTQSSQVGGNLQDQHQARSTDSADASQPSTTPSVPHFEKYGAQPAGTTTTTTGGDHRDNSNNRASMRKNQAKIQAILQDLARRNATAGPRTTTAEPQDSLDLHELASHAQFVRPTAGPASELQEPSVTEQTTAPSPSTAATDSPNSDSDSDQPDGDHHRSTTVSLRQENNNQDEPLDLNSLTSKTTRFYSPAFSATTASMAVGGGGGGPPTTTSRPTTQHHRYPIIDTLSAGRQKINKPVESSPDGGYHSHSQQGAAVGDQHPAAIQYERHPTTLTSKLTESVSNNQELRQTIRNRATSSTTPMPSLVDGNDEENTLADEEQTDAATASDSAELETSDGSESLLVPHRLAATAHKRRRPAHQGAGEGGVDGAPYMQAPFERPSASEHESRPIIIRRKPSRRPAPATPTSGNRLVLHHRPAKPQQQPPVRISLSDHSTQSVGGGVGIQQSRKPAKKRKKPSGSGEHKQRPSMTLEPVVFTGGESSGSSGSSRPKAPPTLILRPDNGEGEETHRPTTTQLIRKRPPTNAVRVPPNNIRLHEHQGHKNKSQLVLPLESVIKRKHQDIRTRPLTIIDNSPPAPALNDQADQADHQSTASDAQRTGTTILHKNMIVTYKPGRPLPGGEYGHAHQGSRYPGGTTPSPPSSAATIFIHSAAHHQRQPNATTMEELLDGSLAPSRVQLGSGNGGDTLLVSIEQQQAQQAAQQQQQQVNRRPPAHLTFELNEPTGNTTTTFNPLDGSGGGVTTDTSGMTPTTNSPATSSLGTTTTTAATPTTIQQPTHPRPIIVINGLTLDPASGNLVPAGSSGSSSHSNSSGAHHSHKARPLGSRPSGNSLVESGSMSVVASASHGSGNSSRPLFGRPHMSNNSSSSSSSNHHNQTSNSLQESTSLEGNPFTMTSQQTADSVVGPEMPNFGSSSSSSGGGHIGMPHFGSLPAGSKPSSHGGSGGGSSSVNQRPYSWRVRKRPNGNGGGGGGGSSHAPYDYHTSGSSLSTSFYRPQSLGQFFSWSSITGAFDNLQIILARLRTFLISIMVMFLPPIALTASIVNAMSS